jgi:predicted secreted protein
VIHLDAAADGRSVAVAVGDLVELVLEEPRGGGYQWSFELPDGLRQVDQEQPGGPVGAPGTLGRRTLRMTVARPGRHVMRARLGRPWEAEPVRVLTVVLDAR